jgi:hypothetical protein
MSQQIPRKGDIGQGIDEKPNYDRRAGEVMLPGDQLRCKPMGYRFA